jgi:hypothetical protein
MIKINLEPGRLIKMNLYRIYWGDSNDRSELGRVKARDIDQAVEYAIKQYLNNNIDREELIHDIDYQGPDHCYVMLNACLDCEYYNLNEKEQKEYREFNDIFEDEPCEYCEQSTAYLEIYQDNEEKEEYKTIFGVNEYADLSTEDIRPKPYNPKLKQAWDINPQLGVDLLMHQTIENNPKIKENIDPEYLKRINTSAESIKESDK